mmetsp:Transcript_12804/g.26143  ORF Transcript_12804/g.26143 Transcript_12804/m.26143 type:complete len:83 (-) Transcript_12804:919-1167(-)
MQTMKRMQVLLSVLRRITSATQSMLHYKLIQANASPQFPVGMLQIQTRLYTCTFMKIKRVRCACSTMGAVLLYPLKRYPDHL